MAPKKSAVYFFALECKQTRGLKGNMREVIEAIYTEWQAMTPFQRSPYERQAKETRESELHDRSFKATLPPLLSAGASSTLSALSCDDPFYDLKVRREQTRSEVEKLLKGKNDEAIVLQPWYIIKFVTFCRCDVKEEGFQPYYVLGEVGIVEYSLTEGITASYHSFIKPNKIPMGYLSKCMDSSRDVHKIPIEAAANNELVKSKTYEEVYREICQFVAKKDSNNNWTRLFCMSEDLDETEFALEYLWRHAKSGGDYYPELHTLVSDLECLVLLLAHNQITAAQAGDILTKISYDYSSNTKCKFHDEEGVLYCALGLAKRKAYLISDHLCPMHGISVTPNHLPIETPIGQTVNDDVEDFRFKFRQAASGSRSYWRTSNRRRDDYDQDDTESRCSYGSTYDIRYGRPKQESREDYSNRMSQKQQTHNSQQQQQRRVAVAEKLEQMSQVSMSTSTMTSRTATDASVSQITSMTTGTTTTTAMTDYRNSRRFEGKDLNEVDEDFISVSSLTLNDKKTSELQKKQQQQQQQQQQKSTDNNGNDVWYPVVRPKTPSQAQLLSQQQQSTDNAWSKPLTIDQPEVQNNGGLANNNDSTNRLKTVGRGRGRGISRF